MATRFLNDPSGLSIGYPIIGANSITFSEADAVYINTSGFLDIATSVSRVLGFSAETISTLASDNQTVAKVTPKYYYASNILVVITATGAITQTMVGEYADLVTVTSGAQTLSNTTSATAGQFFIWGFDPTGEGTTTDAVVSVAEQQFFDYAQP